MVIFPHDWSLPPPLMVVSSLLVGRNCTPLLVASLHTCCIVGGKTWLLQFKCSLSSYSYSYSGWPSNLQSSVNCLILGACFNIPSIARLWLRASFCVSSVWHLLVRGGFVPSLVAVFDGVASVPTILPYHFSVILRAVFCDFYSVSNSERSILCITCLLAAFRLPVIELVIIGALPFEFYGLSGTFRLWRCLRFFIIFHRSCLIETLQQYHLRELVVLLTSVQKGLDFSGSTIHVVAVK